MANERNVDLMNNFDKKNIESIDKHIREDEIPQKVYRMLVDESGHKKIKVSEESRKICAENLLKWFLNFKSLMKWESIAWTLILLLLFTSNF